MLKLFHGDFLFFLQNNDIFGLIYIMLSVCFAGMVNNRPLAGQTDDKHASRAGCMAT